MTAAEAGAAGEALQARLTGPVTSVCAYCAHFGRGTGAAREYATGRWRDVPHAYVALAHLHHLATDGVCWACAPVLRQQAKRAVREERRHG